MSRNNFIAAGVGFAVLLFVVVLPMWQIVGNMLFRANSRMVEEQPAKTEVAELQWETYTNSERGFSISYPSNSFYKMRVAEPPFDGYHATFLLSILDQLKIPDEIAPRVQIFSSNTPITDMVQALNEARNKDQFPEFFKIELAEYEAYQTHAYDHEVIFTQTVIGNTSRSFIVELFSTEKENKFLQELYKEMVASFKILE